MTWKPLVAVAVLVFVCPLYGQESEAEPPASEPPAEQAEKTDPPADAPRSLDELLGIEDDESTDAAQEAADREAEDELQRRLDEEAVGDAFRSAIHKMNLSAELLDKDFDSGLGTQRIQEDIIRKLDQLIEFARQQQGGGSSSSSSSSQQSQSSSPSPGKQSGSPQQGGQRNQNPAESSDADPPAGQQGDINRVFEESRSEWGSLPERVRDQLLQGRREKHSSLYERLTIEYFRRLAEEGSS